MGEGFVTDTPRPSTRPIGPANDAGDTPSANSDTAAATRAQMRASARAPQHRIDRAALGKTIRLIDMASILILTVAGAAAIVSDMRTTPAADLAPILAFACIAVLGLNGMRFYDIPPRPSLFNRVASALLVSASAGAGALIIAVIARAWELQSIAYFTMVSASAVFALQLVHAGFIHHWARSGRLASNVVVIGATSNARALIAANEKSGALNVVGVFDDRVARSPSSLAGAPYLGDTDALFQWPLLPEVDRILVTVSPKAEERVRTLLAKLRALPQPVSLLLDMDGFDPESTTLEDIVEGRAARLAAADGGAGWQIVKRLEDLVLGGLLFIAALPVMALIAIAVKLDSPGPVLFRQEREGWRGRTINVLKFRSMRHKPEGEKQVRQVELNDPRVTRIGGFLRKTSLDELPQLWNVLRGDMSLVGPRPHAPGMKTGGAETASLVKEYMHRYRVKPGITGWAQVNGSRGPLHSPEAARERVRLDVDYVSRAGLWFDLWIMMRTLPALLGDKINIR